MDRSTAV